MIKLERSAPPAELTEAKVQELTNLYMTNGSNVWNKPYIKAALLAFSFGKCCYCECKVDEIASYMEVEHFYPKKIYPEKVVEWENLLPSCKRCNGTKTNHDTGLEPILNPTIDIPNEHLYLKAFRFYGKTELGKMTIKVVDLNDRARKLTEKRFQIGDKIAKNLEEIFETLNEDISESSREKNKIKNTMLILLQESQPTVEYSATSATVLFSPENHFSEIKQRMEELNIWDEELELLESTAASITLFS